MAGFRVALSRPVASISRPLVTAMLAMLLASVACSETSKTLDLSDGASGGAGGNSGSVGGAGIAPAGDASAGTGAAGSPQDSGADSATIDGVRPDASVVVGPSGGTITLPGGAGVNVPPGALPGDVEIRITETGEKAPGGYHAYSSVFRFEPEGLEFLVPVEVTIPFQGDASLASLFWSRGAGENTTGFRWQGGAVAGAAVVARVNHFSKGFIANGVDYSDAPDRSCVRTNLIEGRNVAPSALALFFAADDCWGRPLTMLGGSEFRVKENGVDISSEANALVYQRPGLELFATLLIDASSSTRAVRNHTIDAAKAFLEEIAAATYAYTLRSNRSTARRASTRGKRTRWITGSSMPGSRNSAGTNRAIPTERTCTAP